MRYSLTFTAENSFKLASEVRRVQFIASELSPVQWSKVRRPVKLKEVSIAVTIVKTS